MEWARTADEDLRLCRDLNNRHDMAVILASPSQLARESGDPKMAFSLFHFATALLEELGFPRT